MNSTPVRSAFDTTSAGGAMLLMRQVREPILASVIFVGLGTSAAVVPPPELISPLQRSVDQTNAGESLPPAVWAGGAIAELRRLSGLTWDQLARLFNVSRRALHFWASGKPMAPGNEEHLQRLLGVIRKIDRGTASANRTLLLTAREDGTFPFDILAIGAYERALAILATGEGRRVSPTPGLAEAERAARTPPRPEDLVGALQNRIHASSGRLRAARSVDRRRRS
jgi:transcriptional regulator with XRE-family HTH domain